MNDEQNEPENGSETNAAAGNETAASNIDNPAAQVNDDYYAVDYAKKDVVSTIGDGEMHDEGLVGAGEATTDTQSSMERLTDEQDEAESHDSEQ
ncbi:MAG: hypothetical protein JWR18_3045 [Segetibacter sp.]|jgi:hypothetical protein|nr:hypothetical protein [Segetibacter sp.]